MSQELQLLLLLAIIIAVSKFAGHLSQRYLNQPVVFGEILAGLLFGPTLLNIFGWPVFRTSGAWLHGNVDTLAGIGVLLLMFIAGLETDLTQLRKVGTTALVTALFGVFLPLGAGLLGSIMFGFRLPEALFIGVVLTATSVSISAQTLMEIGQLRSREGLAIMGAAVIDDVLGIIVLSFVIAFVVPTATHMGLADSLTSLLHLTGGVGVVKITVTVLLMAVFFTLAVLIGKSWLTKILSYADRLHASHAIPATALVLVLLFAVAAEYLGQVAAITGAYLVGIFLARTPYRARIEKGIHPFTYALFVPIFFMSIGLGANARDLGGGSWAFVGIIILIAILAKILGCGLGARLTGFAPRESVRVGIGMISRGEVGLIIAQIGASSGLLGKAEYAVMVLMVLATTVVTPILLRLSFPKTPEVQADIYESVVGLEPDEEQEPYN